MRYMGIDYGTKRVGVALSDTEGRMAFPEAVVPNDAQLLDTLVTYIEEKTVGAVIVGHSLDRAGNPNAVQKDIEALIGDITLRTGIPVHLEPEQYTTQEAIRLQGKNTKIDASAAALILNSYLMRVANTVE